MAKLLCRHRLRDDAGFGLIEVVVACVVLGIMAAAVIGVILQAQSVGVTNRSRIAAANLAAREIDIVREEFTRTSTAPVEIADAGTVTNPHQFDGGVVDGPLVVDGTPYTVVRSAQWNITGTGQSACDGGTLVVYPTLGVTVTVTWPNMGSVKPVVSTAALAPEKGAGIPSTDSFVAVKVTDHDGGPSVGRGVAVSGGGATVHGTTDTTGCAVVQVSPAAGVGTDYTAQLTDTGYVDMSSTEKPSKTVGTLSQGQLNNNVTFAVARAGTVNLHLVDSSGASVAVNPANPQTVTLVASEYSGASPATEHSLTSSTLPVTGLWPTIYGAYYGSTPPMGGYDTVELEAGGTIDLYAVLELAHLTIGGMPAGTTSVVAVPSPGTSCAATGAVTVDPSGAALLPGTWSFFAQGPSFACSPGPNGVVLGSGANDALDWGTTTLTVAGAPSGTLYALDSGLAGGTLSSCPNAAQQASAVTLGGGANPIAAGTWYVYVKNGESCAMPSGLYPVTITNGTDYTLTWPAHSVTLRATGIEYIARTSSRNYWPTLYASSVPVSSLNCQRSGVAAPSGTTLRQVSLSGTSNSNGATATATMSLSDGTWYLIANDENSNSGQTRWSNPTCRLAGTAVVGAYTGSLTIDYDTSRPKTVGP